MLNITQETSRSQLMRALAWIRNHILTPTMRWSMNSDNFKLKKRLWIICTSSRIWMGENARRHYAADGKTNETISGEEQKRNWLYASYIVGCMFMTAVVVFYLGKPLCSQNISQASVNSIQSNQTTVLENQTSASKPETHNFYIQPKYCYKVISKVKYKSECKQRTTFSNFSWKSASK